MRQKNRLVLSFLLVLQMLFHANEAHAPSHPETVGDTLYIDVIEQMSDTAMIISNAKVSLAYGGIGEEQSLPGIWMDVPNNSTGKAVFYNVPSNRVYTISAKAPGYFSAQKEFTKGFGDEYTSIALTKAPEGATGSVRIAVMVLAPQSPVALTTAKIDILKGRILIASSDTKNTTGKQGIVFSNLLIGQDYEAHISAPSYQPQNISFEIEPDRVTWLPVLLDVVRQKLTACPIDCTCDEQINILYCGSAGVSGNGTITKISIEPVLQIIKDNKVLDTIGKVEKKLSGNNVAYEVTGSKKVKLFFFIPIEMEVKASVDAETGAFKIVEKPWWSFLTVSSSDNDILSTNYQSKKSVNQTESSGKEVSSEVNRNEINNLCTTSNESGPFKHYVRI